MDEELTYKKAGVDINEGDRFVSLIGPLAASTKRPGLLSDIGSFGGLFGIDTKKYPEPVLVSGTDGVGTKLKVAFMAGKHDTVGIDLVAMCVNDILTAGAEPLFFLDYFATGKLKPEAAFDVIKGIAEGCKQAGCALLGGETAEMPGFYADGEYDLAGFAVGVVNKPDIIDIKNVSDGDALVGIASSGLHSNGYSLARKVFFERAGLKDDSFVPELGCTVAEELLKPTVIYVKAVQSLRDSGIKVKAMAHITGGGITGNLPRAIPDGLGAKVRRGSWPVPPVFGYIKKTGKVPDEDLWWTFNMGIGYILIVGQKEADSCARRLAESGLMAYNIGYIIKKGGGGIEYDV